MALSPRLVRIARCTWLATGGRILEEETRCATALSSCRCCQRSKIVLPFSYVLKNEETQSHGVGILRTLM